MKIAPEHTEDEVLNIMHKEPHDQLINFIEEFKSICKDIGKTVSNHC